MAVVERWPLAEVRLYFSLGVFHENKLVVLGLFYQVKSFTYLKKVSLSVKRDLENWGQERERQKRYITLILHVRHTFWLTLFF